VSFAQNFNKVYDSKALKFRGKLNIKNIVGFLDFAFDIMHVINYESSL
jgi:hypothetical protein